MLIYFRALVEGLLTQEMVDDYDPALMFTIPRLAIVSGLLFYPYMSPLSLDQNATNMSDMFRPFRVSICLLSCSILIILFLLIYRSFFYRTSCNIIFLFIQSLLLKIRELLLTLSKKELSTLEKMLCSSDEVKSDEKMSVRNQQLL